MGSRLALMWGLGSAVHSWDGRKSRCWAGSWKLSYMEYYIWNLGLINTARRNCRVRIGLRVQFFRAALGWSHQNPETGQHKWDWKHQVMLTWPSCHWYRLPAPPWQWGKLSYPPTQKECVFKKVRSRTSLVAKAPWSQCRGPGFHPWSGN